jgi:molybdate transport system substrate-binding protein
MFRVVSAAVSMLLLALAIPDHAVAAELKILSPGATEGALAEMLPQFEKSSGHKVTIGYAPVGALAKRVQKGEAADVVVLSDPVAEELRKTGKTVDGSQTVIAKVGIGIFVRKGDPHPKIATSDDFLRAVAKAKIIAYADPKLGGSSSILVAEILRSLDVTGSIGERTKLTPPAKPLADYVASGAADFGFQPISQIFLDPRVEYVGPLPPDYQQYTDYVASLTAASQQQRAYSELLTFLASPAAVAVWRSKGFEPR